jgi:hypothetical protein
MRISPASVEIYQFPDKAIVACVIRQSAPVSGWIAIATYYLSGLSTSEFSVSSGAESPADEVAVTESPKVAPSEIKDVCSAGSHFGSGSKRAFRRFGFPADCRRRREVCC